MEAFLHSYFAIVSIQINYHSTQRCCTYSIIITHLRTILQAVNISKATGRADSPLGVDAALTNELLYKPNARCDPNSGVAPVRVQIAFAGAECWAGGNGGGCIPDGFGAAPAPVIGVQKRPLANANRLAGCHAGERIEKCAAHPESCVKTIGNKHIRVRSRAKLL